MYIQFGQGSGRSRSTKSHFGNILSTIERFAEREKWFSLLAYLLSVSAIALLFALAGRGTLNGLIRLAEVLFG